MKKSIITSIIATLLIIIAIFAGIVMVTSSKTKKTQDQLQLGQKYLNELNYEQAAATFLAVIEIDEKSVEAYIGAAQAYVGLNDYESAISILEKGITVTGDISLTEFLNEIKAEYELKKTSVVEEKEEQKSHGTESEILLPLYEALNTEDYETAGSLMGSGEYVTLYSSLSGDDFYYYNISGDENDGVGIRVNATGYYYCGNISNGMKNGEGKIACGYNGGLDYEIYSGTFQNDLANGYFSVYQRNGTADYSNTIIEEGNVKNGYYDGEWKETDTYDDDGMKVEFNYHCKDGKPEAIRKDEDNAHYIVYCETVTADGATYSGSVEENAIFSIPTADETS